MKYIQVHSNDNGDLKIRDPETDTTTITISEGVAELKTSGDSKKLKWYYHLIGHEYGHHYAKKYYEDLRADRELDSMQPERIVDEVISDRIGNKIAGMTKEEYVEFDIWLKDEYKRLREVYKNYLISCGQSVNFRPVDDVISDLKRHIGVRYRHL